jgi:hypothetical protein
MVGSQQLQLQACAEGGAGAVTGERPAAAMQQTPPPAAGAMPCDPQLWPLVGACEVGGAAAGVSVGLFAGGCGGAKQRS